MEKIFQEHLSGLTATDVNFITANLMPDESRIAPHAEHFGDDESRRRRHIERDWPSEGTILSAEYYGETYTAEVILAGKRLKAGKQIHITSGPAKGMVCDSPSEAMLSATEMQRDQQSLGRKGVANGWVFWQWEGKPTNIAGDSDDDSSMS